MLSAKQDSIKNRQIAIILVLISIFSQAGFALPAKNVILMIADGAGFNTFACADYYQYGRLGEQPYDSFPVKLACTTFMINENDPQQYYDPNDCWADFNWAKGTAGYKNYTDSAAAATALNTGIKTLNGRLNVDKDGNYLITIAQIADSLGKTIGTVSTVQFSHATPAAVWSHNISRGNYEQIANEMIYNTGLDVIMGAGHPAYDNNGKLLPKNKWKTKFIGGLDTYNQLLNATTGQGWTFLDSKSDFKDLANNPLPAYDRLIAIAQAHETLQQKRSAKDPDILNQNVPDLATMAAAAIKVLAKDPDGFYLMIEAGAVDWANHGKNLARAIEEQIDFNHAVEAVIEWVKHNSTFEETLLIVTADHQTGQLWGPNAGPGTNTPFDLPKNNGKGNLPDAKYFSGGHTNVLVPLYAIGNGSDKFKKLIDGTDLKAAKAWNFSGKYVDNTDVFTVIKAAITKK